MIELKAKEGMYLTQSANVDCRYFFRAIKGEKINADDWRDATKEEKKEYEQLKAQQDAEMEKTMSQQPTV